MRTTASSSRRPRTCSGALPASDTCAGSTATRLASARPRCFGDVNVLHPFREGNGRAQRAFFGQLAREAGYRLAWEGMTREAMTDASIDAMRGENRLMAALLRAHLFERLEPDRAPRVRPAEARGVYVGPVEAVSGETVTQVVAGEIVEHSKSRLTGRLGSLAPGQSIVVSYAGGIGRVSEPPRQKRGGRGRGS